MGYKAELIGDDLVVETNGTTYTSSFIENETAIRNMLEERGGKYISKDPHASVHEAINDWLWEKMR